MLNDQAFIADAIHRANNAQRMLNGRLAIDILLKAAAEIGLNSRLTMEIAKKYISDGHIKTARRFMENLKDKFSIEQAVSASIIYEEIGDTLSALDVLKDSLGISNAIEAYKNFGKDISIRYITLLYLNGKRRFAAEQVEALIDSSDVDADYYLLAGLIYFYIYDMRKSELFIKIALNKIIGYQGNEAFIDSICMDAGPHDRFVFMRRIYADLSDRIFAVVIPVKISPHETQSYDVLITRGWKARLCRMRATETAEIEASINDMGATSQALMGHEAWLAGNRTAADNYYKLAAQRYTEQKAIPFHSNCGTIVWLADGFMQDKYEAYDQSATLETLDIHPPASDLPSDAACLIVGCDSGYFRFFPAFIYSAINERKRNGFEKEVVVHCHVAAPSTSQVEFLEQVQSYLDTSIHGVKLSFSYADPQYAERSFYTCLRYIVAASVIQKYNLPTFIMDIDLCLNRHFFEDYQQITSHDFGLRMDSFHSDPRHQNLGEPWTINAQSMFIKPSIIGYKFLAMIRDYIVAAYSPDNIENWTVDQCAIAQAYSVLIDRNPGLKIRNLSLYESIFLSAQAFANKDDLIAGAGVNQVNLIDLIKQLS